VTYVENVASSRMYVTILIHEHATDQRKQDTNRQIAKVEKPMRK
jgi:hypothetical protein